VERNWEDWDENMTVEELLKSIEEDEGPPAGASEEVRALWHTKKGDWDAAHDVAQDIPSAWGSWMHAHLHVIEGDLGNAGYWYRQAGKERIEDLDAEWREIASAVL
jgi:hypothetical protein